MYYYLITDCYAARTCDLTDVQFRALLKVYNELPKQYNECYIHDPKEERIALLIEYRENWEKEQFEIDAEYGVIPFPIKLVKIVPCSILAEAPLDFIENKANYKKWKAYNGKITRGTNASLLSPQGDIVLLYRQP